MVSVDTKLYPKENGSSTELAQNVGAGASPPGESVGCADDQSERIAPGPSFEL